MDSQSERDDLSCSTSDGSMFFADAVLRDGGERASLDSKNNDNSDINRIMASVRNDVMSDALDNYDSYEQVGGSIFDDDDDEEDGTNNDFMSRTPVRLSNTGDSTKFSSTSELPCKPLPLNIQASPNFSKKRRTAAAKSPKDPWWSFSFILMVPFFLFFVPSYSSPNFHDNNLLGGEALPHVLSIAPTFTLVLTTFVIGPMLGKVLYSANDTEADLNPSQLVTGLANPSLISKLVLFGLVIVSLILTPKWGVFVVTPIVFWWLIVKFLKKVQKAFCPSSSYLTSSLADYEVDPSSSYLESTEIPSEDESESNVSFVAALFQMCLSILSRPVRRSTARGSPRTFSSSPTCVKSLKTLTYIALGVNFVVVGFSLHLGLYPLLQFSKEVPWLPLLAFLASGFWSTAVIRRIVGLVASCIVYAWFERQGMLVGKLTQASPTKGDEGYSNFRIVNRTGYSQVGEDPDDDDEGDEDEDNVGNGSGGDFDEPDSLSPSPRSSADSPTVQSFFLQALTVSFGSVVKCAMLGGLAQFSWGIVRYLDAVERFRQRRKRGGGHAGGFNSMNIGEASISSNTASTSFKVYTLLKSFVRSYNDFGLAHCAAYCKSYRRAALDVYDLIEESRVDTILAGDHTTATCSSCCVTIAGSITMAFGGIVLLTGAGEATDHQIAAMLLINFAVCYMTLFSILEGLRAGVKSIYICFAEHPAAISQK
eukprot:CAMPEP_0118656026 /NCGR_PEP_ID=MMETSP0785-20121206/13263_1 /TAXON_ID=91992 /ORGANISM="Bolidomonas pacifica, Strain CCMP 1866" /LENGTH=706 /DNA_ID=CAMNT_0006548845 /DNA_START=78 /DNA_END=2195 /DNA_ORIENTATION=+